MSNIINLIDWTKNNILLNEKADNHGAQLRVNVRHAERMAKEKHFESTIEVVSANKQVKTRRKKLA